MATWNRNVSMRALRAFCAAARRESFRLAAEDLFLTSSAVSHQIKQLEGELGVQLFQRRPRALRLTDAGRALQEDLLPILDDLDELIERNSGRSGRSPLRLSVQPFFASELLVPRLSEFLEHHPDITVSVDTIDDDTGSLDKSADCSIRLFESPPGGAQHDRLFPLRLMPVGSPSVYDSIRVVSGRITSELTLIVHNARPKAWHRWQRSSGITLPREARTVRLDSMIAVARAAEKGIGAALMPAKMCHSWLESGSLVPLFDHELELKEAYFLVGRTDGSLREDTELFRQWMLRTFAHER